MLATALLWPSTARAELVFSLHSDNSSPVALGVSATRLYVADYSDRRVYVYTHSGQRRISEEFTWSGSSNYRPYGMEVTSTRIFMAFRNCCSSPYTLTMRSYTLSGEEQTAERVSLGSWSSSGGLAVKSTRLYFESSDRLRVYNREGSRQALSEFAFARANTNGQRLAVDSTSNRVYVADGTGDKVYVYDLDSNRQAGEEFDLDSNNGNPLGIAHTNTYIFVLDGSRDEVYRYANPTSEPEGPSIDGLTAAPTSISGLGTITLDATVTHPSESVSSLTAAWTAIPAVGTFASSSSVDTTWTAPASMTTEQVVRLTLMVTDSGRRDASASVEVTVNLERLGIDITGTQEEGDSQEFTVSIDPGQNGTYRLEVSITQGVEHGSLSAFCSGVSSDTWQLEYNTRTPEDAVASFRLYGCRPGSMTVSVQLLRLSSGQWLEVDTPVQRVVEVTAATTPTLTDTGLSSTVTGSDSWTMRASNLKETLVYTLTVDVPQGLGWDQGCNVRRRTYPIAAQTTFTATHTVYVCSSAPYTLTATLSRAGVADVTWTDTIQASVGVTGRLSTINSVNVGRSSTATVTVSAPASSYRLVATLTDGLGSASFDGVCTGVRQYTKTFTVAAGSNHTETLTLYGCREGSGVVLSVQLQRPAGGGNFINQGDPATATFGVGPRPSPPTLSNPSALASSFTGSDAFTIRASSLAGALQYQLVVDLPPGTGFDEGSCSVRRRTYTINQVTGSFTTPSLTAHVCRTGQYTLTATITESNTGASPVQFARVFTALVEAPTYTRAFASLGATVVEGSSDAFSVDVTADVGRYRVDVALLSGSQSGSLGGYCTGLASDSATFDSGGSSVSSAFTLYGCRPGTVVVEAQLQALVDNGFVALGAAVTQTVTVSAATAPTLTTPTVLDAQWDDDDNFTVRASGLDTDLSYNLTVRLPPGLGFDQGTCEARQRTYPIAGDATYTTPTLTVYACLPGAYTVTAELSRVGVASTWWEGTSEVRRTFIVVFGSLASTIAEGAEDAFQVAVSAQAGSYQMVVNLDTSLYGSLQGYCQPGQSLTRSFQSVGNVVTLDYTLYGCQPGAVTVTAQLRGPAQGGFVDMGDVKTSTVTVSAATAPVLAHPSSAADDTLATSFADSDAWKLGVGGLDSDLSYVLRLTMPPGLGFDEGSCAETFREYPVGDVTTYTTPALTAYLCGDTATSTVRAELVRFGAPSPPTWQPVEWSKTVSASTAVVTRTMSFTGLVTDLVEGAEDDFQVTVTPSIAGAYRLQLSLTQGVGFAGFSGYCSPTNPEVVRVLDYAGAPVTADYTVFGCLQGSVEVSAQLFSLRGGLAIEVGDPVEQVVTISEVTEPTVTVTAPSSINSSGTFTAGVTGLDSDLRYTLRVELPPGTGFDQGCTNRLRDWPVAGATTFTTPSLTAYVCSVGAHTLVATALRDGAPSQIGTAVVNGIPAPISTAMSFTTPGAVATVTEGTTYDVTVTLTATAGTYRLTWGLDSAAVSFDTGFCSAQRQVVDTFSATGSAQDLEHTIYTCHPGTFRVSARLEYLAEGQYVQQGDIVWSPSITVQAGAAPTFTTTLPDSWTDEADFTATVAGLDVDLDYTVRVELPVGLGFDEGSCSVRERSYPVDGNTSYTTPTLTVYLCGETGDYTVSGQVSREGVPNVDSTSTVLAVSETGVEFRGVRTRYAVTDSPLSLQVAVEDLPPDPEAATYRVHFTALDAFGVSVFREDCSITGITTTAPVFGATATAALYRCGGIAVPVTVTAQLQLFRSGEFVDYGSPASMSIQVVRTSAVTIQPTGLADFTTSDTFTVELGNLTAGRRYTLTVTAPDGLGFNSGCATATDTSTFTPSATTYSRSLTVYRCGPTDYYTLTAALTQANTPVGSQSFGVTATRTGFDAAVTGLAGTLGTGAEDPFTVEVTADPGVYRVTVGLNQGVPSGDLAGLTCGDTTEMTWDFTSTGAKETRDFTLSGCSPGVVEVEVEVSRLEDGRYVRVGDALTASVSVGSGVLPAITNPTALSDFTDSDDFTLRAAPLSAGFSYTLTVNLPQGLGFDEATCNDRTRNEPITGVATWDSPSWTVYVCGSPGSYTVSAQLFRPGVSPVLWSKTIVASKTEPTATVTISQLGASLTEGASDQFAVEVTADPGSYQVEVNLEPAGLAASLRGFCQPNPVTSEQDTLESQGSRASISFTLYGCATGSVTVSVQLRRQADSGFVDLGAAVTQDVTLTAATAPAVSDNDTLATDFTESDEWQLQASNLSANLSYQLAITLPQGLGFDQGSCNDRIREYFIVGYTSYTAPPSGSGETNLTTYVCDRAAGQSHTRTVSAELRRVGSFTIVWQKSTEALPTALATSATVNVVGLPAQVQEGDKDDFQVTVEVPTGEYELALQLLQAEPSASFGGFCASPFEQETTFISAGSAVTRDFGLYGCRPGRVELQVQVRIFVTGIGFSDMGSPTLQVVNVTAATTPTLSSTTLNATFTGSDKWQLRVANLKPSLAYVLRVELPEGVGFDAGCLSRVREYPVSGSATFVAPPATSGEYQFTIYACESERYTVHAQLVREGMASVVWQQVIDVQVGQEPADLLGELDEQLPHPDSMYVAAAAYGSLVEAGDILLVGVYRIAYEDPPEQAADQAFLLTYRDSLTMRVAFSPYVFVARGYGHGVGAVYLPASDTQGVDYLNSSGEVALVGNPVVFGNVPVFADGIDWRPQEESVGYLMQDIVRVARELEQQPEWAERNLVEGNALTVEGAEFFGGAIPGLRTFAPALFPASVTTARQNAEFRETRPTGRLLEGSFMERSFVGLSSFVGVSEQMLQLMFVGVISLIAAVWGIKRGRGGLVVLPIITVVMLAGTLLGFVPIQLMLGATFFAALVLGFVLWGKRAN